MTKKISVLLLAIVMLFAMLTACDSNTTPDNDRDAGRDSDADVTQESPTPEVEDPNLSATQENTPTPHTDDDDDDGADADVGDVELPRRGAWSEKVYTNQYMGIKITIPDDWEVADDYDIAAMMGIETSVVSGIDDDGIPNSVFDTVTASTFHDAMTSNPNTGASIQVIFERLTFPYNRISASEYITQAAPALTAMGFTVDLSESEVPVKIGNDDWYLLKAEADIGVVIYIHQFISIHDSFVRSLALTTVETSESFDELFAMISALS